MKEAELRNHTNCTLCKQPIGNSGLPFFHVVKLQSYCVDMRAVKRQDGVGAMLGNSALAAVMGPDESLAEQINEPKEITVCQNCWVNSPLPLAVMAED